VQEQGAYVSKNGESLLVRGPYKKGSKERPVLGEIRLSELASVALFGRVQISTEAVHTLMDAQIPLTYFSSGAWFRGLTTSLPSKNVDLRRRQFAAAENGEQKLSLARGFVQAKIENQRTLLRRNGEPAETALCEMKDLAGRAAKAGCVETLLGLEGNAARHYFQSFQTMLKPRADGARPRDAAFAFSFEKRNRRPPEDAVNALLSFVYAVLARELTTTCWSSGLDPFLGFFHKPRFGRPALALDLMEEFRPVIADSVVITAVNTGVVQPSDFIRRGPAVALKPDGRRRFLKAYERRMESLVTHPVFGYQVSYRRVLEVQARLLGRVLLGELGEYPSFLVR
jgi:CRISPR-associated protein Cas1